MASVLAAVVLFSLFLLALGKSPAQFLSLIWQGGFGSAFSIQNSLQRAAPIILTALAFAEPIQGDLPLTALRQPTGGLGEFRGDDRMRGGSALRSRPWAC
jgi:hypothetical protein